MTPPVPAEGRTGEEARRRKCPGTSKPAESRDRSASPHCPECGREMAAQGPKAQRRFRNAWQSVPLHFADVVESS